MRGAISNRSGGTLISTLLALTIAAVCAGFVLQTYLMSTLLRERLQMRANAFVICQSQMERLRAGGYHGLPGGTTTTGIARYRVTTQVQPGTTAGTRQVTVSVAWEPGQRCPAGRVQLCSTFSARGISP